MTGAWIVVGLIAAGWFALRLAEESQRIDDLRAYLMIGNDDVEGGDDHE